MSKSQKDLDILCFNTNNVCIEKTSTEVSFSQDSQKKVSFSCDACNVIKTLFHDSVLPSAIH